jgi:hypothetical protein
VNITIYFCLFTSFGSFGFCWVSSLSYTNLLGSKAAVGGGVAAVVYFIFLRLLVVVVVNA